MFKVMGELCVGLLLATTAGGLSLPGTSGRVASDNRKASAAVQRLWSPDPGERTAAKLELLGIGSESIAPLLRLLEDIVNNPVHLRFVSGKEIEGAAAFQRYDLGETTEYPSNLEITGRLESDACELLGQLRAVEAVPLLVRSMEARDFFIRLASMSIEMKTLVEIGSPAVPKLIEAMETANLRAASVQFGEAQPGEDEERKRFNAGEAAKIRARAARVLGEIGDEQALTVLQTFLENSADPATWRPDRPFIEAAIRRIEERKRLLK